MRICVWSIVPVAALLAACASPPASSPPESPKQAEVAKPVDESRRFPAANLVETKVIDKQLMGKPFMPGGTLATYKKGSKAYNMFLAKLPAAADAAFLLLDWNKALAGSHLVPSFGGYFGRDGQDAGRPVFVFAKGAWIAGVVGLPEPDADLQARGLAAHLN